MILSLLAAIAIAPIFWLAVPQPYRKDGLAVISLLALGLYDLRLPPIVLGLTALLFAATRIIERSSRRAAWWISLGGLLCLALFFVANKSFFVGETFIVVASQGGIALLGVSYFVLKAASILIETSRRTLRPPSFRSLARWLLFFPIFASGPIEAFKHFDDQEPRLDRARFLHGLERILFGCLRALVFAHYLASWTAPILSDPGANSTPTLLLAMYAMSLRIYFDFAGYSDIAIGLSALYGYEIQENFRYPLLQRNIVALWQRWHMTLTDWLRIYVFTPYTRFMMKRGRRWHRPAIITGQVVTMAACGIWHDVTAPFLVWGVLHGIALAWTATIAREVGKKLPKATVDWWRQSRLAYAASTAITLTTFSAINVVALTDIASSARYFRTLFGL